MLKYISIFLLSLLLVGCAGKAKFDVRTQTVAYKDLSNIESPKGEPIIIAVYDFIDMTGQKKPGGSFASMSTAVTQGSYQILIKALSDAGDGKWFRVVERSSLPSLLQERKLIRSTRQQVNGEGAEPLPPLLFAGAYITGGIVGYDSNIQSGGVGARYFGIGTSEQYRVDQVTVSMRIISVQTGEILLSTNVTKTVASHSKGGDVFKFLDMGTKALELETGVAVNEPVNYAIRTAIEFAVLQLVHEGEKQGFWKFKIPDVELHPHNKKMNTEKNGVHK